MKRLRIFVFALTILSTMLTGAAIADSQLSEKEIKRVVNEHAAEIKQCYVKYGARQKSATGHVKLGFVVQMDGTVPKKTVEVEAPGVRGRRFERCVAKRVSRWQFRESGSSVSVEYPFYFQRTRVPR